MALKHNSYKLKQILKLEVEIRFSLHMFGVDYYMYKYYTFIPILHINNLYNEPYII